MALRACKCLVFLSSPLIFPDRDNLRSAASLPAEKLVTKESFRVDASGGAIFIEMVF
jgi:hypothetical protein